MKPSKVKEDFLDHSALKTVLSYDEHSGLFTWTQNRTRGVKSGDIAGSKMSDGYVQICVFGKRYLLHRLAWFYVYGVWPEGIDYVNRIRSDNRLSNLRLATYSENAQNRTANICNTTGFKGVTYHKRDDRYQAAITTNGIVKHLGYFKDALSAHIAYKNASLAKQSHSVFLGAI